MRFCKRVHAEELHEGLAGSVIALQVLLDHLAPVVKVLVGLQGLHFSGESTQGLLLLPPECPGEPAGAQYKGQKRWAVAHEKVQGMTLSVSYVEDSFQVGGKSCERHTRAA